MIFTLASLGLADMPPFAAFLGKGWIGASGTSRGMAWIIAVFVVCSVLVGGAVLRVAGGVFYGLGDPPSEDPQMTVEASEETNETDEAKQRTPLSMIVPAVALVAAGLLPGIGPAVQTAAVRLEDQATYNATVLSGAHVAHPSALCPLEPTGITAGDLAIGLGSAAGAFLLAFLALYWQRLPLLRRGFEPGTGLVRPIRLFQSGVVNDYVTWIVIGVPVWAAPWRSPSGSSPCPGLAGRLRGREGHAINGYRSCHRHSKARIRQPGGAGAGPGGPHRARGPLHPHRLGRDLGRARPELA